MLVAYGVLPTLQSEVHFGRIYAAYGGIFIVLSLAWGRIVDGFEPDQWDLIGASICLAGVLIMFFGPRAC